MYINIDHLVLVVGKQDGSSVKLAEWVFGVDANCSVQSFQCCIRLLERMLYLQTHTHSSDYKQRVVSANRPIEPTALEDKVPRQRDTAGQSFGG